MAPMLLTELPDDKLLEIFKVLQKDRTGATVVWKLVCKTMKRIPPEDAKSSLRAMGYSVGLVKLARSMGASDDKLVLAIAEGGNAEVLHAIAKKRWVNRTGLLEPSDKEWRPYWDIEKLPSAAVSSGNLKMVQLAAAMGFRMGLAAAREAASSGYADVFDGLLEMQCTKDEGNRGFSFDHPVVQGQVHTIALDDAAQFQDIFPNDHGLVDEAVKGGNLDIVKRVVREEIARKPNDDNDSDDDDNRPYDYENLCTEAAKHDQVHILQWAAEQMPEDSLDLRQLLVEASDYRGGCSHDVLKWLHGRMGDDFDPDEVLDSCDGDFEIVKFLLEELNVPVMYRMMASAVMHDNPPSFDCMEYMHSKGCPKDLPEEMMERGNDDSNPDAYEAAAESRGAKAIAQIRWLHDRGYGIVGSRAVRIALRTDDPCVLGVLLFIGLPFDEDYFGGEHSTCFFYSDENWDNYAVVKWARANGYHVRPDPRY